MKTKRGPGRPKRPKIVTALRSEVESLSSRLDAMHEILDRKNEIIRLLCMGDCTASELRLSDK